MKTLLHTLMLATMQVASTWAAPAAKSPFDTIIPGQTDLYNTYRGKAAPFPGNLTKPIPPTVSGPPGPDDMLFQNLLSAEWIIYSFYQQGVEMFNASDFTTAGYPNTTYDRIAEIRDNEAGHLNIFYDSISPTSLKPGPCTYQFNFTSPTEFLALQLIIEVGSMAFITGLVQQARLNPDKGAIAAIGQTETRHTSWALAQIWSDGNPFAGPVDTEYPYANHILHSTKTWIKPGSCPAQNPPYPAPVRDMPYLSTDGNVSKGHPGEVVKFEFTPAAPKFCDEQKYYVVYFHGVENITVPYDWKNGTSRVPKQFDAGKGVILASITDAPGAVTEGSVLAGPVILNQQPAIISIN